MSLIISSHIKLSCSFHSVIKSVLSQVKTKTFLQHAYADSDNLNLEQVFAKLSLVKKMEELKEKLKAVEEKCRIFGFSLHNSSINEDMIAKKRNDGIY